jgi:POLQ-like helicase
VDSDDEKDGKARRKNIQLAQTWPYGRHKSYEKELRKAAADWYSRKGLDTHPKRNYILKSRDNWRKNIISDDVVNYIEQKIERHLGSSAFPLHNYLHHGLSSQAMTFNLIGPLIVREDFGPLRDVLAQAGISWPKGKTTVEFEYDDREVFNEDSGQPTSFDIAVWAQYVLSPSHRANVLESHD